MNTNRRQALVALCAAGLLWGTTVPLSKLALEWLPAGWLTAARFGLAAALLLPFARRGLRAAFTPRVLIYGAIGYGGTVIVQNAGITRTSVTHAALMIGAVPVLVAVISAVWLRAVARPVAWAGFAVSLAGVALVTGGGGGGATPRGDALVLASLLLSATFTVAQAGLRTGRATACCQAAAMIATRTGAAPISRAACVTLVRAIPAFCIRMQPPYPRAPEATTRAVNAARSAGRGTASSRTTAASPKRVKVSQPGASQVRAAFDSGTLKPHASPAATRAAMARIRLVFMTPGCRQPRPRFGGCCL